MKQELGPTLAELYGHQATLPRAQPPKQFPNKSRIGKSADFCVQDAGANRSSVLSWRQSVPGSHGSVRVSKHAHATKPAASQPQWPACSAQDLGVVGCRFRFRFPRLVYCVSWHLLVIFPFCWSSQMASLHPGSLTNQQSLKPSSSRAKVWLHAHGLPDPWPHPKCTKNTCSVHPAMVFNLLMRCKRPPFHKTFN